MMSTEYDTSKIDEGFAAPIKAIDQFNETMDMQIEFRNNNNQSDTIPHQDYLLVLCVGPNRCRLELVTCSI